MSAIILAVMKLLVIFGLPGAGKTFVGNVLQKHFAFYVHEADSDLPDDMRKALSQESRITDEMRDRFFQNIIRTTKQLTATHTTIVVTQTFIKEKYRNQFLNNFPQAKFILVETPSNIREARLRKRKEYPLNLDYVKTMNGLFETPHIPHKVIYNEKDGEQSIKKELENLLNSR